jgi:hypothetical protein
MAPETDKTYAILGVSFAGSLLVFRLLEALFPSELLGLPQIYFSFTITFAVWYAFVASFMPRCSKCGLGFLSVFEIGPLPIIMKSWVGKKCFRCKENR